MGVEDHNSEPSLGSLRAAVRRAPALSTRVDALDALLERSEQPPTRFLTEVAVDEDVETDIRLKALAALGSGGGRAAMKALTTALQSSSQTVVRRAAVELAALPGTSQLEALKRVRTGNPTTLEALRWAKLLISYRNRLGEYVLPADFELTEIDLSSTDEVKTGPLPRRTQAELATIIADPILGTRFTTEGAAAFSCAGRDFVALINSELAHATASWLMRGQAIPVIILQRSLETGHFNPSHLTMTDPEGNESLRVNVARHSGAVVLTGTAGIDSRKVSCELVSTKTPYLPPTAITGTLDVDKVRLVIDRLVTARVLAVAQEAMVRTPTPQTDPTELR
jgi:hypothetical protein